MPLPRACLLRANYFFPALAYLLPPHRAVEAVLLQQVLVTTAFDDLSSFQNVNAIRVQDGGEAVRDQYRDGVPAHGDISNRLADLFLR